MKRRDKVEGPGLRDGREDNIPEHIKIWCDLMVSLKDYSKAIPKTDRYQVPARLEGLVCLVNDDSPFLPTGSQLKKAGEEDRDAAVKNLKNPKRQRIAEAIKVEESMDRSHLKPNSGGMSIDQSREKMMAQMGSFLDLAMLKAKTEERKVAGDELAKKRQELKELQDLKRMATEEDEELCTTSLSRQLAKN